MIFPIPREARLFASLFPLTTETIPMVFEPVVFVVDDDQHACKSVCALVRSLGLRAEAFSSAEEFLTRHTRGCPGCLVTDIRMTGMSGLDLQDRLAEQGVRLPVIILTAYPRTRSTVRAMKAGAVTLLEKPYDEEELWDAIRKALAQETATRAEAQRRAEIRERAARLTPEQVRQIIARALQIPRQQSHVEFRIRQVSLHIVPALQYLV